MIYLSLYCIFQDATPLSLSQELSGFVQQLSNSITRVESSLRSVAELAAGKLKEVKVIVIAHFGNILIYRHIRPYEINRVCCSNFVVKNSRSCFTLTQQSGVQHCDL